MSDHMLSESDAAFLSLYDVDPSDPVAPELLASVDLRAAKFKAALWEMGPDDFLRHLAIQVAQLQAVADGAIADRAALLRFHQARPGDVIH